MVIAIQEYKVDAPVAIVEIPFGRNPEQTFIAWNRQQQAHMASWTDNRILRETKFTFKELNIERIWLPYEHLAG